MPKHGENGKGVKSRWYAQTLAKRIRNIQRFRDKITFIQGDGIAIIEEYALQETAAFSSTHLTPLERTESAPGSDYTLITNWTTRNYSGNQRG